MKPSYKLQNGYELMPHQKEGVLKIRDFKGRALLADEPGLGKTTTTLTWYAKTNIRRALIVCPASLKHTWAVEAEDKYGMKSTILDGQNRDDCDIYGDLVIINYDIFQHWENAILRWGPEMIALDEAQKIKNRGTIRSKSIKRVARKARSVIAITGTPIENHSFELWNILDTVNPTIFPKMMAYSHEFCFRKFHPKAGWIFYGAKNTEKLNQILLEKVMIRRRKSDILTGLPDKSRKMIYMVPDAAGKREYEKAEQSFLHWLSKRSISAAKRAGRNETLTKIGYLLRLASELKEKQSIRWIEEFLELHPDRKLVVFSVHRRMIDAVMSAFKGRAVKIDGSVNSKDRRGAVTQFQGSKRVRLFVGQVEAAGTGLTLTAASDSVFLDLPWNPAKVAQAEDRIHRIGQAKQCTIYYHIMRDTIEQKVARMIYKKADAFSRAIDGEDHASAFRELISA